jgi:hypothetical protein
VLALYSSLCDNLADRLLSIGDNRALGLLALGLKLVLEVLFSSLLGVGIGKEANAAGLDLRGVVARLESFRCANMVSCAENAEVLENSS